MDSWLWQAQGSTHGKTQVEVQQGHCGGHTQTGCRNVYKAHACHSDSHTCSQAALREDYSREGWVRISQEHLAHMHLADSPNLTVLVFKAPPTISCSVQTNHLSAFPFPTSS